MWCGVLVYKGTLRFGALCLSGCLVWCWGLVLGWPFWEGELPPPPRALRAGAVWDRCLELSATQRGTSHGGLVLPWFVLSSSALKGVSVWLHQFLPSVHVSSVLPPLTQALRSQCSKMGWVQSSKISAELLIYSHQTAFSFLTSWLMRSAPCMGISSILCVIPVDPICTLGGRGATKGLINSHTTQGSALIAAHGLWGCAIYLEKSPLFGSNQVMCNEWLVCVPLPYFLCLIMHTTISAPDKWVISSWSKPAPSDACLLAIVALVIDRWPMRFDRGGKVINQLHQVICSAVCILRGLSPLESLKQRLW